MSNKLKKWLSGLGVAAVVLSAVSGLGLLPNQKIAKADTLSFDSYAGQTAVNPATSVSHNHNVGSGTHRILFAGLLSAGTDVTAATYNGSALTQVAQFQGAFDSRYLTLYCIANPTSGSNSLSVTTGSSQLLQLFSVSYAGAKQSCTPDAVTSGNSSSNGNSFSQTVTTVADNSWTLGFLRSAESVLNAGTGTTARVKSNWTGFFDSGAVVSPAGNSTLAVTTTGVPGAFYGITIAVAPFPPNAPPTVGTITPTPNNTYPGATVDFATTASDSDGTIASYAWAFGDGGTATSGAGGTATASHVYTANGTYTVTVTATDNIGATGTNTATVTIRDPIPTWSIQSVDQMKYSKDVICSPPSDTFLDNAVTATKDTGANTIAIATPYNNVTCSGTSTDPDVLAGRWISRARTNGLRVWHRHAGTQFEGIYGQSKHRSPDGARHLQNIATWIHENASLIQNGDIFTPEAEPQNGGISGVTYCGSSGTCQFANKADFNEWLRTAQLVTKLALKAEGFNIATTWGDPNGVFVGAYGFDGFIVWGNDNPDHVGTSKLETATVAAMDNVIAIDHYNSAQSMATDLDEAHTMFPSANYVIGEWGAIASSSDSTALTATQDAFTAFAARSWIIGVNYWHLGPGTNEGLLRSDFTKRPHYYTVQDYYKN